MEVALRIHRGADMINSLNINLVRMTCIDHAMPALIQHVRLLAYRGSTVDFYSLEFLN